MKRTVEFDLDRIESFFNSDNTSPIFAKYAYELSKAGNDILATQICEHGLKKHKFYITAYLLLAKLYIKQKRYSLAKRCLEIAQRLSPNCLSLLRLQEDFSRLDLNQEFVEYKKPKINLDFKNPPAVKPLKDFIIDNQKKKNDIEAIAKKLEEAKSLLIRANENYIPKEVYKEENSEVISESMLNVYLTQKKFDKALIVLDGLVKLNPNRLEYYTELKKKITSNLL